MKVLFVCTGNICRSPMGEAILRREAERAGIDLQVRSAGTGAWDGASASEGAYLVALENGLDLSGHSATLLTKDLVDDVDLILTMARHHRVRVEELGGEGKTFLLGEYAGRAGADAEVSDPFGSDIDVYRQTYEEIDALTRLAFGRLMRERRADD